ncbi:MAG TPA: hypothetical protein VNW15_02330 [Rhizomicrobium sp.]|jgi:hypothetical protein|nr:hypothetical protein [Rhizomicrobium sp.]
MDDAKLRALLNADTPPAADPRFVLTVMTRIEQRRFRRELAMTAGLTAIAALLLALLVPTLEIVWDRSLAPLVNNVVIAVVLLLATIAVPKFFSARND